MTEIFQKMNEIINSEVEATQGLNDSFTLGMLYIQNILNFHCEEVLKKKEQVLTDSV